MDHRKMDGRKWTIAKWTVAGAAFGAIFGALASIFQGGPAVIQGIQETWWWFAIAGFLTGMTDMTGSNNGAGDPSIQSP